MLGLFAGGSGSGQWRQFLLWRNGAPFGTKDPYFNKDVGFYVFDLPWLHYLVDFGMALTVLSLLAAAVVHYLFGGIRLQAKQDRLSGAAQVQISVLAGLLRAVQGRRLLAGPLQPDQRQRRAVHRHRLHRQERRAARRRRS